MAGLFNLAADRALHMSEPSKKISITIGIGQPLMGMAGGGGLSSVQKKMNIGGQPHKLAYINSDEASLLKQLGGSGRPVNGVPAFNGAEGEEAYSSGRGADPATTDVDEGGGYTAAGSKEAQQEAADIDYALSQIGAPGERGDSSQSYDFTPKETTLEDRWNLFWRDPGAGVLKGLQKAVPWAGKSVIESFLSAAGYALGGVPAALISIAAPYAFDLIGAQTWEEQISDLRSKGKTEEADALQEKYEDYQKSEAKREEELAQADTGLPEEIKIKKILDVGEKEEEEEEEGRWDDWYSRPPTDPYKGFEDRLEEIYGENWREILERGVS